MLLGVLCERFMSFSGFDRKSTSFDCTISFLGRISGKISFGSSFIIAHHC